VLEDESGVDDVGAEHRLFAVFRFVLVDLGDTAKIEHAAGGSSAQGMQEANGTVIGQGGSPENKRREYLPILYGI
jgi:hypothetical protein